MYSKYKEHFIKVYEASEVRFPTFPHHVDIVAKWVDKICDMYPEADREVAMIAAWFHDLGHFIGDEEDHAVDSEKEARRFLVQENFPKEKMESVLHAVRSHRNRDVIPETLEARIVCCADSASHFTSEVYLKILPLDITKKNCLAKLERDFRDISDFPEIKKELEPLYFAWKDLINSYPEDFIQFIQR